LPLRCLLMRFGRTEELVRHDFNDQLRCIKCLILSMTLTLVRRDFLKMPDQPAATVYFDGSCPLCRAEIALYRRQAKAETVCFVDASNPTTPLGDDLDRHRAMRRFHVRKEDGRLVSGAAAFVEIWKHLPRWRWAARAAAMPGMLVLLEIAYKLFLAARPYLARRPSPSCP